MCVVTQTVERVARELRTTADRLARYDALFIVGASRGQQAEVDALVNMMREEAKKLRAQAKLLDGKD